MAKNKSNITQDNMGEWMASTGFLFPRNLLELSRFEKLYADVRVNLEGHQVDPEKILGRTGNKNVIQMKVHIKKQETHFRMAARKGDSNVPQHILDKIKSNQDKRKQDDSGSKEENA